MTEDTITLIASKLRKQLPFVSIKIREPLADYTTIKIGGPADILAVATSRDELLALCRFASEESLPLTVLGWGANSLISDSGIRGLTIINRYSELTPLSEPATPNSTTSIPARWKNSTGKIVDLFSYYDGTEPVVEVECGSGTPLPYAINKSFSLGLTGLEWFSRIPATIGGAIYNNVHGANHFISEQIQAVTILNENNQILKLDPAELQFEYDSSRFHHTREIIISATLLLYRGNVTAAKDAAVQWAQQKKHQPQQSLGCVFQNVTESERETLHLPTSSVGYFIDKVLQLKGYSVGDAQVSDQHAAFIVNKGAATAADYLEVVRHIQQKAREHNVTLLPEIFFLGFDPNEITDVVSTNKEGE